MADVTRILENIRNGKADASDLVPLVYEQLKRIAADQFVRERPGHTLQVTALVNEAYLRLFGSDSQPSWANRAHFLAAAAEAMRRILVDYARRRGSQKRGGSRARVALDDNALLAETCVDEVLDVDHWLEKLAVHDPPKAELVKLRYFAGLTMEEIAKLLGISLPTANRHWAYARAWLFREMTAGDAPADK